MFAKLTRLASDLVGLIYPAKCLVCDGLELSARTWLLCDRCLAGIAARPLPEDCGQRGGYSPLLRNENISFDLVFAGWHYDAAMQLIIPAMKYRRRPSLLELFGGMLAERLQGHFHKIAKAALVPVPLHRRRERERGFNQSLLLARAISEAWNVPVLPQALRRVRFTQSQAKLDAAARWENVKEAFAPAPDLRLHGYRIFLVDDVFTTGATTNACAIVLKSVGATQVDAVALAKAGHAVSA
jgi:ComF family protein